MGLGCRTPSAAQRALEAVTQVWQTLTRTRHATKTRLVERPYEGGEWLGCHVRKVGARTSGRLVPRRWPGRSALTAGRSQMRSATRRRRLRGSVAAIAATRNPRLRGWRTSVRVGHSTQPWQALERDVRRRRLPWGLARLTRVVVRDPRAWRRQRGIESC